MDSGAVTGSVCGLVAAIQAARISSTANGHTYFDTTGTTISLPRVKRASSNAQPRDDETAGDKRDSPRDDVGPRESQSSSDRRQQPRGQHQGSKRGNGHPPKRQPATLPAVYELDHGIGEALRYGRRHEHQQDRITATELATESLQKDRADK